jgi:hypothetical protein
VFIVVFLLSLFASALFGAAYFCFSLFFLAFCGCVFRYLVAFFIAGKLSERYFLCYRGAFAFYCAYCSKKTPSRAF